jgi:hypothetical protein
MEAIVGHGGKRTNAHCCSEGQAEQGNATAHRRVGTGH